MKRTFLSYLCCFLVMLYALNLCAISPLIGEISVFYNQNLSTTGLLFTSCFLGFVLLIFFGGVLSEKFGKKKILNFSVLGFAASAILHTFSPSFSFLCIAAFFAGGFGGILETIAGSYISDLNPKKSSFYINLTQVFFGIGAVISPFIVSILLNANLSWKVTYVIISAFSFIIAVFFISINDITNEKDKIKLREKESVDFSFLKDKSVCAIFICLFLYVGAEVGSWGWLVIFMQTDFEFSSFLSATLLSVFWISMTAGRFICGFLTNRFKIKNILLVLSFSSCIFVLLSSFTKSQVVIWLIVIAMGFSFSSLFPLLIAFGEKLYNSSAMLFSFFCYRRRYWRHNHPICYWNFRR